jgi:hypothetical protein
MASWNFIPLGDHCASALILKELGLRKVSYPFDWITKREQVTDTNIFINLEILRRLTALNAEQIAREFIGNAGESETRINVTNDLWFPHDEPDTIIEKYTRRFTRLYTDIHTHEKKNMFIIVTRSFYIERAFLDELLLAIKAWGEENKLLFFSGAKHDYLEDPAYADTVIFKYRHYEIGKIFGYDYSHFRPWMKEELTTMFRCVPV